MLGAIPVDRRCAERSKWRTRLRLFQPGRVFAFLSCSEVARAIPRPYRTSHSRSPGEYGEADGVTKPTMSPVRLAAAETAPRGCRTDVPSLFDTPPRGQPDIPEWVRPNDSHPVVAMPCAVHFSWCHAKTWGISPARMIPKQSVEPSGRGDLGRSRRRLRCAGPDPLRTIVRVSTPSRGRVQQFSASTDIQLTQDRSSEERMRASVAAINETPVVGLSDGQGLPSCVCSCCVCSCRRSISLSDALWPRSHQRNGVHFVTSQ